MRSVVSSGVRARPHAIVFSILATGCLGDAGALDPTAPSAPPASQPSIGSGLVYTAEARINRVHLLPVPAGGLGPSRALGPARGAGYGVQEGSLRLLGITPDGRHVIVGFEGLDRSGAIFLLATNGSSLTHPRRIAILARPDASPVRSAISRSGRSFAYVDRGDIYVVGLAEGADTPVLVARRGESRLPEVVLFSDDERFVVFGEEGRGIFAVSSDGSTLEPRLITPVGPNRVPTGVIAPGGRILVRTGDVLYSYSVAGTEPPVRLTPESEQAGAFVGMTDTRVVLELRLRETGGQFRHRLVSVRLDGSDADHPVYLSAPALDARYAQVVEGRVVYIGETGGQHAVFEESIEMEPVTEHRLSSWLPRRLYLGAVTPTLALFCDYEGRVYRSERGAREPVAPTLLASFESGSNHCALRGATGSGYYAVVAASPTGEHFLAPVDGGAQIPIPFAPRLITDDWLLDVTAPLPHSAVIFSDRDGGSVELVPWGDREIAEAHLVPNGTALVYRTTWPDDRWYAVPITTDGAGVERAVAPEGADVALVGVHEGHAVFIERRARASDVFAIDGSDPSPEQRARVLSGAIERPVRLHEPSGRVVARVGDNVVSARIDGSDFAAPTEIAPAPEWLASLSVSTANALVLVADGTGVVAAPIDGSGNGPRPIANAPGALGTTYVPTLDRVLVALYTLDTAVPHAQQLVTVRPTGEDFASPPQVAPPGVLPVGMELGGFEIPPIPTAPDGWMLLMGPSALFGARPDGASRPVQLFAFDEARPQWVSPYAPRGSGAVVGLADGRILHLTPDGVAELGRTEGRPRSATWTQDGRWLVFIEETREGPRLRAIEADRSQPGVPRDLAPLGQRGGEIVGALNDDVIVFASSEGGDHSLYRVSVERGDGAIAITPVDDATERWVGVLE